MHLLDYAFYIQQRKFEMLQFSLTLKLGYHPLTKGILVAISNSPPKQPPIGPCQSKIVEICNAIVGLFFLYVLETT
jgi:hypothetical protein